MAAVVPAPVPAPAPAIPASVQYWFNYRDQFMQANQQHGNILGLLAANNNTFPPFDPPELPTPNLNCRYNGPNLIANEKGPSPTHIRPNGVGVLVGLWPPQDRNLPLGNQAWDPFEWCAVYGKAVKARRFKGRHRSTTYARYWVRRINYLGDVHLTPPNLPRTRPIALRDVFCIQACQGLSEHDMLTYIRRATVRATLPAQNAHEARVQFTHMRHLQRAHLHLMPQTPRRDRQRQAFLLP